MLICLEEAETTNFVQTKTDLNSNEWLNFEMKESITAYSRCSYAVIKDQITCWIKFYFRLSRIRLKGM